MSAPLVWIVLPGLLAGVLILLQRREALVSFLGTIVTLGLAALAWWLPEQERFFIGPWTLEFTDTLSILGRRFLLEASDRPALVVLYLTAGLWFGAASVARSGRIFVPLGLGAVVLLTAAIAVEPFLYAALLIEMAVLVSIPFLVIPGKRVGRGLLRYLTFQTLGMPFILFTGWLLTGAEAGPVDAGPVLQASVLIVFGFAFLLAVFPFYTWIPMLAEEAHPYAAAFIFFLLPGALSLFGLNFLDRFAWLRTSPNTYFLLRSMGILMVVTAGVWAAFQQRLDRMLAYALILEIGLSFIAVGLAEGERAGAFLGIFFAALLPRGLSLGVWALALAIIDQKLPNPGFQEVRGIARRMPLVAGALLMAHFSLAGLPLLAGFHVRLALLEGLAQVSLADAVWVLLGLVALLIGGLRTLAVLVMGEVESAWEVTESWTQRVFLTIGMAGLLTIGLFPQWFLPLFANLPQAFEQLVP
jgi:formate hydrogenlyase subunit 3/multisubunit Na+/H+ antiporter MnhD subunit